MTPITSHKIKKEDITCPHCGQKNTWTQENSAKPFCSARCKLIDLGAWADESHRIPGESVDSTPPPPEED